jgi:hypothetical protein
VGHDRALEHLAIANVPGKGVLLADGHGLAIRLHLRELATAREPADVCTPIADASAQRLGIVSREIAHRLEAETQEPPLRDRPHAPESTHR